MRLNKKADRIAIQTAEIERETAKGYTLETYKGMKILTALVEARNGKIAAALKVYYNTAAKAEIYKYYQTAEQRAQVIDNLKKNFDSREQWKKEQKEKGGASNQAQAAAAIREELKQFTGIKFSVTSEGFSMGDAVRISWTDGPTDAEVSAITGKYEYGHFNGMEDIYEYSNRRDDIPQTKYVTQSRKQSEETRAAIEAAALQIWTGEDYQEQETRRRKSYEAWSKTSIPAAGKVTGIVYSEEAREYVLTYEAPEQPEPAPAQHEAQEVTAGTVQIVDYSLKAIAVIGDTKPIKDKLKALGGKFNFRLTCGAGWIFPKSRLQEITKALSKPKAETPNFGDKTEAFENSTIEERLNDPFIELTPEPEEIEEAPMTAQEIAESEAARELSEYREEQTNQSLAMAANYDKDEDFKPVRKQEFCTPTTAPAFFRENGCTTGAEQRAQANAVKLYSEHREGMNTGRAQQGFLF